jgi:hypothetical protein
MTSRLALLIAVAALVVWPAASPADAPIARAASTCADYPTQTAAQQAADTRDGDGDGIYCEDLPCPCSSASPRTGGGGGGSGEETGASRPSCTRPSGVRRLVFDAGRYPHIRAHYRAAVKKGWPRVLVLNRPGADARRDRLLDAYPTRDGQDRDEYPPAVGRGKGRGLTRGSRPRGWQADVRYVPSAENRSHGASMGSQLRGFCDGTRFRYVFRPR